MHYLNPKVCCRPIRYFSWLYLLYSWHVSKFYKLECKNIRSRNSSCNIGVTKRGAITSAGLSPRIYLAYNLRPALYCNIDLILPSSLSDNMLKKLFSGTINVFSLGTGFKKRYCVYFGLSTDLQRRSKKYRRIHLISSYRLFLQQAAIPFKFISYELCILNSYRFRRFPWYRS